MKNKGKMPTEIKVALGVAGGLGALFFLTGFKGATSPLAKMETFLGDNNGELSVEITSNDTKNGASSLFNAGVSKLPTSSLLELGRIGKLTRINIAAIYFITNDESRVLVDGTLQYVKNAELSSFVNDSIVLFTKQNIRPQLNNFFSVGSELSDPNLFALSKSLTVLTGQGTAVLPVTFEKDTIFVPMALQVAIGDLDKSDATNTNVIIKDSIILRKLLVAASIPAVLLTTNEPFNPNFEALEKTLRIDAGKIVTVKTGV